MACFIRFTRVLTTKVASYCIRNITTLNVAKPSILPQITCLNTVINENNRIINPISHINPISLPNIPYKIPFNIEDIPTGKVIEEPSSVLNEEIKAARLIVIRRKKMKKHKLRKLRKKMKFEWAKIRQKRELKKEKVFQAGLIAQYKKAELFSAEKYVAERLNQYTNALRLSDEKSKRN